MSMMSRVKYGGWRQWCLFSLRTRRFLGFALLLCLLACSVPSLWRVVLGLLITLRRSMIVRAGLLGGSFVVVPEGALQACQRWFVMITCVTAFLSKKQLLTIHLGKILEEYGEHGAFGVDHGLFSVHQKGFRDLRKIHETMQIVGEFHDVEKMPVRGNEQESSPQNQIHVYHEWG